MQLGGPISPESRDSDRPDTVDPAPVRDREPLSPIGGREPLSPVRDRELSSQV